MDRAASEDEHFDSPPIRDPRLARIRVKRGLRDEETRKLLQEVVFKDTRLEWVRWAKEELIHVPAPGQDIILLPTTRPSGS